MGAETIDGQFQQDIQRLGFLSCNPDALDSFNEEYERILTENYNQMMLVRNVDKLLEGVYSQRALMLKALLQRQLDHFGLEWPDTTRKPVSDTSGRE
jgi:hypothetical protein